MELGHLISCMELGHLMSCMELGHLMSFIELGHFMGERIKKKICFIFKQSTRRTSYPILFCYITLHVSGIFFAHHQEFSTVYSALVSFVQVLMTASKQGQDGTS
jgi:hypothetical protein